MEGGEGLAISAKLKPCRPTLTSFAKVSSCCIAATRLSIALLAAASLVRIVPRDSRSEESAPSRLTTLSFNLAASSLAASA